MIDTLFNPDQLQHLLTCMHMHRLNKEDVDLYAEISRAMLDERQPVWSYFEDAAIGRLALRIRTHAQLVNRSDVWESAIKVAALCKTQ